MRVQVDANGEHSQRIDNGNITNVNNQAWTRLSPWSTIPSRDFNKNNNTV
jgi:hypothetical protein